MEPAIEEQQRLRPQQQQRDRREGGDYRDRREGAERRELSPHRPGNLQRGPDGAWNPPPGTWYHPNVSGIVAEHWRSNGPGGPTKPSASPGTLLPRGDRAGAAARDFFSSDAASGVASSDWYTGGKGGGDPSPERDLGLDPKFDLDALREDALGAWQSGGWDEAAASVPAADPKSNPTAGSGSGSGPGPAPRSKAPLQPDWSVYNSAGAGAASGEPVRSDVRRRRRSIGAGASKDPMEMPSGGEDRAWVEGPIGGVPCLCCLALGSGCYRLGACVIQSIDHWLCVPS